MGYGGFEDDYERSCRNVQVLLPPLSLVDGAYLKKTKRLSFSKTSRFKEKTIKF